MEKFETPEIEIGEFAVEDVITTSNINGGGNNNDLPLRPV